MKAFLTIIVMTSAVCGQSSLTPPEIGFVQDCRGALRPVRGLAGNFLVDRAGSPRVVSAAFSGSFGLVKSDSALAVIDKQGREITRVDAPRGPALLAFSADGRPALAYFEQSVSLVRWDGREFQSVHLDAAALKGESVVAIAASIPYVARFVVKREGELWELDVRTDTGALVSQMALPGIAAPVLLLPSGDLVHANSRGFVIRDRDGSEKQVVARLPQKFTLHQMGLAWVAVNDEVTGRLFALSLRPGRERCYELPGARP